MTTTDTDSVPQLSTERIRAFPEIPGTCYGTDMRRTYIFFQALSSFSQITIEQYRRTNANFGICRYWELEPHHIALIYPQTIYGTFPEPFRNKSGNSTKN